MRRYFRHEPTGAWARAWRAVEGEFQQDGNEDANALARAMGWEPGTVASITVTDDAPDPRSGELFGEQPDPGALERQRAEQEASERTEAERIRELLAKYPDAGREAV